MEKGDVVCLRPQVHRLVRPGDRQTTVGCQRHLDDGEEGAFKPMPLAPGLQIMNSYPLKILDRGPSAVTAQGEPQRADQQARRPRLPLPGWPGSDGDLIV